MLTLKDQKEARWLIQNFLYQHLMKKTDAPFYTCFFIKSPASHRSYWLVHISKHPKARDEMALRHWAMSNHFIHHGRAGLRMLGFDPECDIQQIPLDFMFDDNAEARSKAALMSELPPLIFDPELQTAGPPTMGRLFTRVCNETPATTRLVSDVILDLRAARNRNPDKGPPRQATQRPGRVDGHHRACSAAFAFQLRLARRLSETALSNATPPPVTAHECAASSAPNLAAQARPRQSAG